MAAKTVNELTLKLNADVASLKSDLAGAKGTLNSFKEKLKDIGGTLKAAFTIGAIIEVSKQLIEFGKETLQAGAALSGVKKSFDQLNQPGLLAQLRAATGGTISDIELMRSALDADDMKVPFDKLAIMMQYLRQDTQESGKDMMQLVDTIVTGLGKGSAKALIQVGISTKEYKEELKKTGDMATAVTNIMLKRLKETGTYVETAKDITARWGATWENIKGQIGLVINAALVKIAPVLDDICSWVKKMAKDFVDFVVGTYNGFVELYNKSMAFRAIIEGIGFAFTLIWQTIKLVFNLMIDRIKMIGKSLGYVFNPSNWGKGFSKGLAEIFKGSMDEVANDFKNYGTKIGDEFSESIWDTAHGNATKITAADLFPSGGSGGLGSEANKAGKEIGKKVKEGLVSELKNAFKDAFTVNIDKDIFKKVLESFSGFGDALAISIDQAKEAYKSLLELTTNFGSTMATKMGTTLEAAKAAAAESKAMFGDIFSTIGEGLGNAMVGQTDALSAMFDSILTIICDFAISLGKQMIALGTTGVILKKLLLNPVTAIAAGIGLIAVATMVKSLISKGGPKFAGGGVVGGYSFSGDRVPILANSGEMILNSGQQANLFKRLNSGIGNGGGTLSARVSGGDLLFIMEQAKNRKGYLY